MYQKSRKLVLFTSMVALVGVLAVLLAFPTGVSAGGWVVISLDNLPGDIVAGQTYSIGMMARQHGRTPWVVDELRIEARHAESGQTVTFSAKPDGQPGHYQAELVFPEAGKWGWGIASGLYPDVQPMPPLEVASADNAAAITGKGSTPGALLSLVIPNGVLGILALVAFAAGVVMLYRSRNRESLRIAGIGLLILCGGLAFALFSSTSAEAGKLAPSAQVSSSDSEGRRLFLAKGCVVCHVHNRAIVGSAQYGVEFGPNLTNFSSDADYLRSYLKDPAAIKPGVEMPDLGLSQVEIDALVEFINNPGQP